MGNLMNTHVRQEAHPTETETAATHSQACQNGSEIRMWPSWWMADRAS